MSTLYVDNLEPNLGSQVEIPDFKPCGHGDTASVLPQRCNVVDN